MDDLIQLMTGKAFVFYQHSGRNPELRNPVLMLHVNMRRFAPIRTEKDESILTFLEDCRHFNSTVFASRSKLDSGEYKFKYKNLV